MTAHFGFWWSTRIGVGMWVAFVKAVAYWAVGKELK